MSSNAKSSSGAASAARFIDLQHQIRVNQTEVRDYLNDLDQWGENMKRNEEELKRSSIEKPLETKLVWLLHIIS